MFVAFIVDVYAQRIIGWHAATSRTTDLVLTCTNMLRKHGVVNKFGQTHDIANLFISDGSQFTTGGAENPTLTIVTLAIRQAEYIGKQMGQRAI